MNSKKNKIFFALTIVLCILLFAVKLTGPVWHVVFGVLLTCMMGKHTFSRWARLRKQKRALQAVDQILMASLIVMFVSGMLMHPLQGVVIVKLLHKLSAVIFVLAMLGHVAQHSPARKKAEKCESCSDEV